MNADPLEIQKFSELAHRWWDPTSEFRPLHEINPLRLEWINARVALAGKKVIDIGCGGGILTESMAKKGANATGIDLYLLNRGSTSKRAVPDEATLLRGDIREAASTADALGASRSSASRSRKLTSATRSRLT